MLKILQRLRNYCRPSREELEKELASVQRRAEDISKETKRLHQINREKTDQAVDRGSEHEAKRRQDRQNVINDNHRILKDLRETESHLRQRLGIPGALGLGKEPSN